MSARQWGLTSLLYHGIRSDKDAGAMTPCLAAHVPLDRFEAQMRWLKHHCACVTADEVLAWIDGRSDLPPHAVLVTFDDGYLSNKTLAMSVLERYGVPALVFLTTDFLDHQSLLWTDRLTQALFGKSPCPADAARTRFRLAREFKQLSPDAREAALARLEADRGLSSGGVVPPAFRALAWEDVRAMKRTGLVSFGAHSRRHHILSRCPDNVLEEEVLGSKARVEQELSAPCPFFAYPNGEPEDVDARTLACVRRAGFKGAFAAGGGVSFAGKDPFMLGRRAVPARMGMIEFMARVLLMTRRRGPG